MKVLAKVSQQSKRSLELLFVECFFFFRSLHVLGRSLTRTGIPNLPSMGHLQVLSGQWGSFWGMSLRTSQPSSVLNCSTAVHTAPSNTSANLCSVTCTLQSLNLGAANRSASFGTSYTPSFLKQIFFVHSFQQKRQNVVTLKSNQKRPCHKQIMEIQRVPEVTSKNILSEKEARWTISSEHIDCQEQF